MSCLIVLQDGRASAPASWAFDAILRAIADELTETEDELRLADWLRKQASDVQGLGRGRIDLREMTPRNQALFQRAVRRANERLQKATPSDARAFAKRGWMRRLRRLALMMQSVDKGEPPEAINDAFSPIAPTGLRRGPGWRQAG